MHYFINIYAIDQIFMWGFTDWRYIFKFLFTFVYDLFTKNLRRI